MENTELTFIQGFEIMNPPADKLYGFFERTYQKIFLWLEEYKNIHQANEIHQFQWSEGNDCYVFTRKDFEDFQKIYNTPLYKALK